MSLSFGGSLLIGGGEAQAALAALLLRRGVPFPGFRLQELAFDAQELERIHAGLAERGQALLQRAVVASVDLRAPIEAAGL